MKVIVSGEVISAVSVTADAWKLHQLFVLACQGRHAVFVDPPTSLSTWLATIDSASRSAYASAIELCVRQATSFPDDAATIHIIQSGAAVWSDPIATLTLDDALGVMNESLGVLVENSTNDWHFLCKMMRPSERKRIQNAVKKGWVSALHGGGSTLLDQVKSRMQAPAKALRTFVVFDSDRLHPDELAPSWTPDRPDGQPAACQAFGWEREFQQNLAQRYWMLKRRFIESYMPLSEIGTASSDNVHTDAVEACTRMPRAGRLYFNMKKGFAGDEKRHDNERCRDLFSQVTDPDRLALKHGFGSKLADHYGTNNDFEFDWDEDAREEAEQALPNLMRLI